MANELYTNIPNNKLGDILASIRNGKIGLPDLQRPFVWPNTKVRDLLDSMMKGYPIGYIMVWDSPDDFDSKKSVIGENEKAYQAPKELIIDGQQRLTALVSALYAVEIKDKNFAKRVIKIAYNPFTKIFEVNTPAYDKMPEWIPDISALFLAKDSISKFRKAYIIRLNEYRQKNSELPLTEDEEELVEKRMSELLSLDEYNIPTLDIASKSTEEDVADIFVRVNSGGQKLNQDNFILTLVSVYEPETRNVMDKFCADSRMPTDKTSYNHILQVDPSHLVRMAVGIGFRRARLEYAYKILRGKNLETGESSASIRAENFETFNKSVFAAMNLNDWHAFLNIVAEAGYLSGKIIASSNAVVFSYVLYHIAKHDYKMDSMKLKRIIKRWFFMASTTYFYSGNVETDVEKQFADMKDVHSADEFENYLERIIKSRFTADYFSMTLPMELETSASISPSWFAFLAAQNILNIPMLFSTTPYSKYLLPGSSGDKSATDKHHIFPKHYLTGIGFERDRDRNQVANFTYLDYQRNIDISDKNPAEYVVKYKQEFGEVIYQTHCDNHALPLGFEDMEYLDFLKKRRKLMAHIIQRGFNSL